MPINNVPIANKYKPGDTLASWWYASEVYFNHAAKQILVTCSGYSDREAAYSGAEPIEVYRFGIGPIPKDGLPSYDQVMAANATLFGGVASAIDAIALTRDRLSAGEIEAPVAPIDPGE